jgi:hypothetical protein
MILSKFTSINKSLILYFQKTWFKILNSPSFFAKKHILQIEYGSEFTLSTIDAVLRCNQFWPLIWIRQFKFKIQFYKIKQFQPSIRDRTTKINYNILGNLILLNTLNSTQLCWFPDSSFNSNEKNQLLLLG